MNPYDSISFDETGVSLLGERNGARLWLTDTGDSILLFHFAKPPNIGADINSIVDVRKFYRDSLAGGGVGLIEVETSQVEGCVVVRTIFKAPQEPTGMTYVGSLTLPFRDFSYVIKVQCAEEGVTGIRDAVIFNTMLESGKLELDEDNLVGWMQDPYDPTVNAPLMRNLSEDIQYDVDFPDHPLSRLRAILGRIQASLHLAPEIKNAPPFVFTESPTKKPWWKVW